MKVRALPWAQASPPSRQRQGDPRQGARGASRRTQRAQISRCIHVRIRPLDVDESHQTGSRLEKLRHTPITAQLTGQGPSCSFEQHRTARDAVEARHDDRPRRVGRHGEDSARLHSTQPRLVASPSLTEPEMPSSGWSLTTRVSRRQEQAHPSSSASSPRTTTTGLSSSAAARSRTCWSIGRPSSGACSLALPNRAAVPAARIRPAARTIASDRIRAAKRSGPRAGHLGGRLVRDRNPS